jgi:hypothetical protein
MAGIGSVSKPAPGRVAAAGLRRLCSLMGQGRWLVLSGIGAVGVCVLYVLRWHLMGSAECRAAWLKSQSVRKAACYRIDAVICSLPGAPLHSGARLDLRLVDAACPGYAGLNSVPRFSMACMMIARRRSIRDRGSGAKQSPPRKTAREQPRRCTPSLGERVILVIVPSARETLAPQRPRSGSRQSGRCRSSRPGAKLGLGKT